VSCELTVYSVLFTQFSHIRRSKNKNIQIIRQFISSTSPI